MSLDSLLRSLPGQPVLVLGLGSFGGGAGCAAALAGLGAQVTVTDLRRPEQLREALAELAGLPIRQVLGGHPEDLFAGQLVVVNPAVPPAAPVLELARRRGCHLTTEVNLALAADAARPALAVTGTHGKSTCAALAAHLLARGGFSPLLAGNLGGSLFASLRGLEAHAPLVVELSSFQLERLEAPPGWPRVAVLTSLGDDHLDRHGDRAAYWAAKRRLLAFQDAGSTAVLPLGCPAAAAWREEAHGRVCWIGTGELPSGAEGWFLAGGRLRERLDGHERELAPSAAFPFAEAYRMPSLLGAVAGARLLGLPPAGVAAALPGWPGLEHRMQRLPAPPGRIWIDNGVATHPEPTAAALGELPRGSILCAGGYDKGLDLRELVAACRRCGAIHLSGPGGRRLAELLAAAGLPAMLHPGAVAAMTAAVTEADRPGAVLLYSPSFSSFDEFLNFRERARRFQEIARAAASAAISCR